MTPEKNIRVSNANAQSQERDELDQFKHLLRQAMPPVPPDQLESRIDLWPQLHARIESQLAADRAASTNRPSSSAGTRVPWFDWALAALAAVALLFYPGIIPALLYHF